MFTASPPANVDVAVELVALMAATCGVEVDVRLPEESVEIIISLPRPVKVTVPVAVRPATERSPEIRVSPWTESVLEGVVVPMPTLPPRNIAA